MKTSTLYGIYEVVDNARNCGLFSVTAGTTSQVLTITRHSDGLQYTTSPEQVLAWISEGAWQRTI